MDSISCCTRRASAGMVSASGTSLNRTVSVVRVANTISMRARWKGRELRVTSTA